MKNTLSSIVFCLSLLTPFAHAEEIKKFNTDDEKYNKTDCAFTCHVMAGKKYQDRITPPAHFKPAGDTPELKNRMCITQKYKYKNKTYEFKVYSFSRDEGITLRMTIDGKKINASSPFASRDTKLPYKEHYLSNEDVAFFCFEP